MQEKTLLKISLICSLIGLTALFFISNNLTFDEPPLITKDELDSTIKVKGKINKINEYEKNTIIEIIRTEKLKIVLFGNVDLKKGDYIEAIGKLKQYRNNFELIADEVKLLS
jgi:hypothetical protein